MSMVNKVVCGCIIRDCKVFTINACLPKEKYIFVKGSVYDACALPLSYCAVEVVQIDNRYNPPKEISTSVTFTDEFGYYGVSLFWNEFASYILKAYSR